MEVQLSPDLLARLNHLAAEQGQAVELLVQEAVERLVNHDEWFIGEVEKGMAAAARGAFVEHDEIARRIASRYPG